MVLAIVLVLLVIGSLAFHFISPWWFTPIASNWTSIDTTINITFWVTGFVFVAVNLFLAYCVYRFRYSKKRRAHYEPENKKLEGWLTLLTSIGIIAMLAPGLVVWAKFIDVPEDAMVIEAVGQQWKWTFRLPGVDGQLGKVDTRLITAQNPFGINPQDNAGRDDLLVDSPNLQLPLNRPIKVLLRSKDVLHNFAVPEFRVKMDLVPGQVGYLWFTPTRLGDFEILCMELCGIAHYAMRAKIKVVTDSDFETWSKHLPSFASSQQTDPVDPAQGKALYAICSGCHGVSAMGNTALNAPRLNGLDAAYLERQIDYFKRGIRGYQDGDTHGQQMAMMANTLADQRAVRSVSAYIAALPMVGTGTTIAGDSRAGEAHYVACGICHGQQGEGNPGLNAPRLAGQNDWYLKRQLQNFSDGTRGLHPQDLYGRQMSMMSKVVNDDGAIDDLISYLNSLSAERESMP